MRRLTSGCLVAVLTSGLLPAGAFAADPVVSVALVTPANNALHVTHAGDSRLFLVERAGIIRIYEEGQGILPTPFLDISSLVGSPDSERGLYAMAFHPDYATNGYFFVSYLAAGTFDSVIARYQVSADPDVADPGSEAILITLDQPDHTHNGGMIGFSPVDGHLYVSFADGACCNDPVCAGQRGDTFLSKLLRLDVDQNVTQPPYYGIPSDNPFLAAADPGDQTLDEVWALGLRNPYRFTFDRLTGDLFIGDVGEADWEEIDYQPASSTGGENYGWKVMEANSCKHPVPGACPPGVPPCFDSAYTAPIYAYAHSDSGCAVVGGFVYRGSAIPDLYGWYVFADHCRGAVRAIQETSPGQWGNLRELLVLPGKAFGFGEDADGEVYVQDRYNVYRLVDGVGRSVQSTLQQTCINRMNSRGAVVAKKRGYLNDQCVKYAGRQRLDRLGLPPEDRTLAACLDTDPRGRVQRFIDTLSLQETRVCRDPNKPQQVPDFAYTSAAAVSAAAVSAPVRLVRSLLGPDPDAAIVFTAQDAAKARCQADVARDSRLVFDAIWTKALEGKRGHLRGRWGLPADLGSDLAARVLQHVDDDIPERIGRKLDQLDRTLGGACTGLDLDELFPGDCGTPGVTAAAFRDCVHERARCYFCRSFESFDGLVIDCDDFDDGTPGNGSCPSEAELVCGAPGTGVHWDAAGVDCPTLSQYRLFTDPTDPTASPNPGGVPYDLTTPLFSDYAQKYRFVFTPPGTQITYDPSTPFDFPVGTIISKTFSFAYDLRDPGLGEEVVETRLLVRRPLGWEGLVYVWDAGMTEATLTPAGTTREVTWTHFDGSVRSTTYEVPSAIKCGFCHFGLGDDPIGPTARLLNRDYPYAGGTENQLDHWSGIGILTGAPPSGSAPRLPVWDDPSDGTLEQRARAYLESNCAHCHNPDGRAGFTGLTLRHDSPLDASYGVCDPASDGGAGSGLTYGFVPGAPAQSVALFRMGAITSPVKMPEVSRSVVHEEGVALVDAWMGSLSGGCP
jgi:uncharacterized repeat protein (TIGR03806 family)